jgi:hypothetical protein
MSICPSQPRPVTSAVLSPVPSPGTVHFAVADGVAVDVGDDLREAAQHIAAAAVRARNHRVTDSLGIEVQEDLPGAFDSGRLAAARYPQ